MAQAAPPDLSDAPVSDAPVSDALVSDVPVNDSLVQLKPALSPSSELIRPPPYSETWFLAALYRLQLAGDNRLVYQFGNLGQAFHPDSNAIRLALGRAAIWQGRCDWALGHLRAVESANPSDLETQTLRLFISLCLKDWRNDIFVSGRFARHKSLHGISRKENIKIAPGSRISAVCAALMDLCHHGGFKSPDYGPSSGTDVWLGLDFASQKASLEGGDIVNFALFRRITTRGGFGGDGVSVRYTRYWQKHANKLVVFGAEAGSGNFGLGARLSPVLQNHIALDVTYERMFGPNQSRFVGRRASPRWRWQLRSKWRLRHTVIMGEQRSQDVTVASYGVAFPVAALSVDATMRHGQQIPAHKATKSLAATMSGLGITLYGANSWPLSTRIGLDLEVKRYVQTLAHLARPHSDKTRIFTIGIGKLFGSQNHLKVEMLFKVKKVLSENTLSARSDNLVTIYFNYKIPREILH